MSFRDLLARLRGDPSRQANHLAELLLREIALYGTEELARCRTAGELSASLVRDLRRAYDLYLERVGGSEEAKASFHAAAARLLGGGREDVVRAALEGAQTSPPPATTPE